jgi:hypothetical protein
MWQDGDMKTKEPIHPQRRPGMSKYVVDALQFGMMARICAEANPELTEEQLMADATPLPASAQFAGEMEEAIEGLLILAERGHGRNDAVKDLFVSRGKDVLAKIKTERENND